MDMNSAMKGEKDDDDSKKSIETGDTLFSKLDQTSSTKDPVYVCARTRTPLDGEEDVKSDVNKSFDQLKESRKRYRKQREKSKQCIMYISDSDTESEDSFIETGQKLIEAEVYGLGLNLENQERKELRKLSPKSENRRKSESLSKEPSQSDIQVLEESRLDRQSKTRTQDSQSMEQEDIDNSLPAYFKYVDQGKTSPYLSVYNQSTEDIYIATAYLSNFLPQSSEYFTHYPEFIQDADSITMSSCNIPDILCPWFHCGPLDIGRICSNLRDKLSISIPRSEGIEVDLSPPKLSRSPFRKFKCVKNLRRKRQVAKEKASRKAARKEIRKSFEARNQTIEIETIRDMIIYMTSVPGTRLEAEELARHMNGPQISEELRYFRTEMPQKLDLMHSAQKRFETILQQICEKSKANVELYSDYDSKIQEDSSKSISGTDSSDALTVLASIYTDQRILLQNAASNFCDLLEEFYEEFQKSIELYNEKRIAVKKCRNQLLYTRIYKLCKLDPPPAPVFQIEDLFG